MENITEQYVDYDVFEAYLGMDDDIAAILQKRAQDEENRLTDEQFAELIAVIDGYINMYREKSETLAKSFQDERNGALKKIFYRTMLEVFTQEKIALS